MRLQGDIRLRRDGVDRVDDQIERLVPDAVRILGEIKGAQRRNIRVRVDIQQPFAHRFGLSAADRAAIGHRLPVKVGFDNRIAVHEQQTPDARADERLGAMASHAAHAKQRHAAFAQLFKRRVAEQGARARKHIVHLVKSSLSANILS